MSPCRIQTCIRGWLGSRSQKSEERGGGDRKRGGGGGRENGDCYISGCLGRSPWAEKAGDTGDKETSAVRFQKTEERHAFGRRMEGAVSPPENRASVTAQGGVRVSWRSRHGLDEGWKGISRHKSVSDRGEFIQSKE